MLGQNIVVRRAFATACLEGQLQRAPAATPLHSRQPPAQVVVPRTVGQTEAQPRRQGETVAEGGEAVAELRLQPPAPQFVAAAVVVGGEARQRAASEQRIGAARRCAADGLLQRQPRPPVRGRALLPGERAGEAALAEARRRVGRQTAPARLGRDAVPRAESARPPPRSRPKRGSTSKMMAGVAMATIQS